MFLYRSYRNLSFLVAFGLILICVGRSSGETLLNGVTTGTLSAALSPYLAAGDLSVPAGESLLIEPGVTIIFEHLARLVVEGELTSNGEPGNGILFRGATPKTTDDKWGGIFISNSGYFAFSNCTVVGADVGIRIRAVSASMAGVINACDISGCDTGVKFETLGPSSVTSCRLTECLIYDCAIRGVLCDATGSNNGSSNCAPLIEKNEIHSNPVGIECHGDGGSTCPGSGVALPTISENLLRDNPIAAIKSTGQVTLCYGGTTARGAARPIIRNNLILDNPGKGVWLEGLDFGNASGGYALVENNVIWGNELIGVDCGTDAGSSSAGDTTIRNNIIARNGLGIISAGEHPTISCNTLWQNTSADFEGFSPDYGTSTTLTQMGDPGDIHGNLHLDPQFVDFESKDYHLLAMSPCIDTGTAGTPFALEPEPRGPRVNRGRYGNTAEATSRADTDNDQLPDRWEMNFFHDMDQETDDDADLDLLVESDEYAAGTSPIKSDSDSDGIWDGDELYDDGSHGDFDGYQTDPLNPDTDDDGILDGEEVAAGGDGFVTDPTSSDTDSDLMPDGYETANLLDPTDPLDMYDDRDGDKLDNFIEALLATGLDDSSSPTQVFVAPGGAKPSAVDTFETIQAAVDSVKPGESVAIHITAGDYAEEILCNTEGARIALIGDSPDSTSIISADFGASVDAVIAVNLTVRSTQYIGIRAANSSSGSRLIAVNCVVQGAKNGGIALYAESCVVARCQFQSGTNQEAILARALDTYVLDSSFTGAWRGVYADNYPPRSQGRIRIDRCRFAGMGVVASNRKSVEVSNSLFVGTGISLTATEGLVRNVTVTEADNAIYNANVSGPGTIRVENSILWANTHDLFDPNSLTTFSSCLTESALTGEGMIHQDPLFMDPESGDYRLQSDSPAIDASGATSSILDLGLQPRLIDAPMVDNNGPLPDVDMGAFERPYTLETPTPTFTPTPSPTTTDPADRTRGDFDHDGCTNINDFLILLDNWQNQYEDQLIGIEDFLNLLDHWQTGPGC